jgi:Xaa-Pro aminopeptidase
VENAVRRSGSDYWAIPVELASGNRSAGCHGTPRNKIIETGDLVHAEFAGVSKRYHATAIQTVGCGKLSSHHTDIYNIALESLNAGIDAIGPGISVADVEEASLQPLVIHGFEDAAMMRFGYGIGIAYPPIWLETLQISRDFDTSLEPGMAFVLHSCLEFPEDNLGVIVGGTYLLEEQGLRMLAGAGSTALG